MDSKLKGLMMLELANIEVGYGRKIILRDVNFRAEKRRCYVLVGANGSGKTTLLKAVAGLILPKVGTVTVNGAEINRMASAAGDVGLTLGGEILPKMLTVKQLITLKAKDAGIALDPSGFSELLKSVKLDGRETTKIGALSLGLKQRLDIACLILQDPEVMLLDEPMNGLDPEGIQWLKGVIERWVANDKVVILSTHLLAEASSLATDALMVDAQTVIQDDLRNSPSIDQAKTIIELSVVEHFAKLEGLLAVNLIAYEVISFFPRRYRVSASSVQVFRLCARNGIDLSQLFTEQENKITSRLFSSFAGTHHA